MLPVPLAPLFAADRTGAVETLQALAAARFVFHEDLVAFGAHVGLDPKLLAVWLSLGLVYCGTAVIEATRGETAQVVALTPKGAKELSRATGGPVRAISSARVKRSGAKLAHDALVGRVALTALIAAREGAVRLEGLETDDKALATSAVLTDEKGGATRIPLQPDGYLLTHDGTTLRGTVIEVDRDTTAAKRLGPKFAAYAAWQKQNGPEKTFAVKALRVVTLVPDERRADRLRNICLEAVGRPSAMFLFALSDHLSPKDPDKLFEPIAKNLAGGLEPILARA